MNSFLQLSMDLFGIAILFVIYFLSEKPSQILISAPSKANLKSGDRSESIDVIRGLAITGIVFIHVNSYYQYFGPDKIASMFTLLISNLSRFGVPAFILSSGIFLKPANFRDYWKPKILSLLVPYFFSSLLAAYIKLGSFPVFGEFISGLLLGTWCAPYYFVPLLFCFYLAFPLLLKIREKYNAKIGILIFLSLTLILNFVSNHIFQHFANATLKNIEPILPTGFLFFFTFGLLAGKWFKEPVSFRNLLEETSSPLPYSLGRILIFGLILYVTGMIVAGCLWKFDSSNHLIFYPLAMFLFLFLWVEKFHAEKRHKTIIKVFAFLGKNSMGIFLLHPILIHLMHTWNPFEFGTTSSWILIPFIGLINIVIPLSIWFFINRIFESFQIVKKKIFPG
ncbi:acyltransferase [Leptospira sp. WS92.C1]